mmetsp:Transcript_1086/g.2467  ORF Transcript_1086/g.2467 Transcript_1086/m.2467 type:complete len:522 (+) Transcript_1086:229-1794(+)|eukprot:CAMPEP_0114513866 /NCGR_PEP_ID=MMETSP0109-20121206/15826_1 /TAXON_ID=29199 /ORGANISM="Chlorarachnion reptans, Strain CCCM449" /LENGTH=521 /DNA_ID=CAMNT_0001693823 /DNA_START=87 /DNA_END=1652 /DNA_ORIENTATION=+
MVNVNKESQTTTPKGDFIFDTSRFGLLGKGAHAVVIRACHREDGNAVAVKIVGKSFDPKEAELLMKLNHPNIVRMYDLQKDDKRYYIITELCRGGELFDLIAEHGPLPQGLAQRIMRQLVDGIRYLHSMGVTHWDIKPENLLLTEDFNLKIADFGFAVMSTALPERPRGTIPYMAPEFVNHWVERQRLHHKKATMTNPEVKAPMMVDGGQKREKGSNAASQHEQKMTVESSEGAMKKQKASDGGSLKLDTQKADMWSVGIVMHCVLAGSFPFKSPTKHDAFFKLHSEKSWSPDLPEEDQNASSLMLSLLEIDPSRRPTAEESLRSKWLAVGSTKTATQLLREINTNNSEASSSMGVPGTKRGRSEDSDQTANTKRQYVACKTEVTTEEDEKGEKPALEPNGPENSMDKLPVKRLGWILPGKSVRRSNKFLEDIGKAVAEIGFDADLDTDDFFVVARREEEDKDLFIVTLFQLSEEGRQLPSLLLDVQRLSMATSEFNNAYRNLRVALKGLNAWNGRMIAST